MPIKMLKEIPDGATKIRTIGVDEPYGEAIGETHIRRAMDIFNFPPNLQRQVNGFIVEGTIGGGFPMFSAGPAYKTLRVTLYSVPN